MRKLREADATPNAGKDLAAVLQALKVSQSAFDPWRNQCGGDALGGAEVATTGDVGAGQKDRLDVGPVVAGRNMEKIAAR